MRNKLIALINSRVWEITITSVIILNAITLGLETSPEVMAVAGPLLILLEKLMLTIFVIEIGLRIYAFRAGFFRDVWGVFDFVVIAIALVPASGPLQVLRALRILRVIRLVSVVPSLRRVVGGLVSALPGMGSIMALLALVYYVFAVMATNLFGASFPDWFGSIGASLYSLFQIMTLESWSMGIVRPVMEVYPAAWLFFVPFIICTTFAVLNLFIGVIVSAMQQETDAAADADRKELHSDNTMLLDEVRALRAEIRALSEKVRA